ncbi:hypothetical protein [Streptomyces sp. NPDC048282]
MLLTGKKMLVGLNCRGGAGDFIGYLVGWMLTDAGAVRTDGR